MSRAGREGTDWGEQINVPSMEQREPLLRTKLFAPPPRQNRVNRPRLIERINSGLDKALILISAPAGYGKTTLVSSWLHEAEITSAWISLDEDDNDPARFLQNLIAAIQTIIPTVQWESLRGLQGVQRPPYDAFLRLVINEISRLPTSFVLILDDFHAIQTQSVLEMLTFLLEHVPPQMHLLLLSRTDPPLPLSRLRARDQLVEIRVEHLRFTNEEIAIFLNKVMGLRVPHGDIIAMEGRTEGWIAGLQLAALSMQRSKDIHAFVSAFTGSHYYIMDYLTEEVLKLQPEGLRSFLLQTSILSSMCGSLCDTIVDVPGTEPFRGQATLEHLETMNLFVIPLDNRRQWYRYHHLFADVLNLRLEHSFPEQLASLHLRATHWYEKNGMIAEAIHHALKAGDQPRAAQLVEEHGCSLLMRGEGFTLLKWVEAVESYAKTHPWLAILKAWALALTGREEQVEQALQTAEGLFSPLPTTFEVKIMLGSIAAARAFLADLHGETSRAADFALGALEYLPEGNDFSCSLRSVATSILGDASWMNGNLEDARHAYLEAMQISQAAGNIDMTMIANSNLAHVLMEQGQLHQAARIFSATLEIATRPDGQMLPLADRLYGGLGEISYEWNQLEAAARYIDQCIELCQQWGNSGLLAEGCVMLARVEHARCNLDKAHDAVRAAERLLSEQQVSPRNSPGVKLAAAQWWITQGSLERAIYLLRQSSVTVESISRHSEILYRRVPEYILLLRLVLAQGEYDAALSLTERLVAIAEDAKRLRWVIEILVLEALALQGRRDIARALSVLEKALSLAQPEGYCRVFLDEGEPMAKLLFQAKSQQIGQGYASTLLSALGGVTRKELPPAHLLIEPLTLRELEVLKLIEAGCTNQDIADRLVISIPTVKRHISNIYGKLGAKNRTQAVSLARELRLF